MSNIRNAESAWLSAKSRYETWRELFERSWHEPEIDTMVAVAAKQLTGLPDDIQQMLAEKHPEEWKKVQAITAKGR